MDFEVEVYDKTLGREWLGAYETIVAHPRHNAQPTAAITVPTDHERAGLLAEPGTRVVIRYQGEFLSSGPVRSHTTERSGPERSLTFQVSDDWRLLRRLLGWQVPGGAITAQGSAEYAVYTGPAETVVKTVLAQNLTRLGSAMPLPVTIAPDQGRGDVITVQVRMHALADRLLPVVDQAGIGVTVRQDGGGLVVDCYEPATWPIVLSEPAGTLEDVGWSRRGPDLTRVVVGGPGEGTDRLYRTYVNAAAEAEWADLIEGFVDARDIRPDDPDLEALMAARGAEALAEAAAKAGLSLVLSETETFRYGGDGIHVGDRVGVQLAPGLVVQDVVREATITDSPTGGLTVTPQVGERLDDDQAVARALGALTKTMRDLRAGR